MIPPVGFTVFLGWGVIFFMDKEGSTLRFVRYMDEQIE